MAEVWASLLTLSALQSPLAPPYALFPLFWLLSIEAGEVRGLARTVGLVVLWLLVSIVPPLSPQATVLCTLIEQFLVLGVSVFLLLRPGREDET